ncbi:MAG: Class flagellar assembly regulator [Candidatus Midichloriaceae bacterium]|jgi:hypothetical protein|nr:Class flagellar assembly regulator [Candidatus Midichloriaceae bacterium]
MHILAIKSLEKKEPIRKTRKASINKAFSVSEIDDASVSETSEISQVNSVQNILSLQLISSKVQLESANYERGENLLDKMDSLLIDKLLLKDSNHNLAELAKLARAQRERSDNTELEEVLDSIELRAVVELAKRMQK